MGENTVQPLLRQSEVQRLILKIQRNKEKAAQKVYAPADDYTPSFQCEATSSIQREVVKVVEEVEKEKSLKLEEKILKAGEETKELEEVEELEEVLFSSGVPSLRSVVTAITDDESPCDQTLEEDFQHGVRKALLRQAERLENKLKHILEQDDLFKHVANNVFQYIGQAAEIINEKKKKALADIQHNNELLDLASKSTAKGKQ
ncbi:uncharacterized protein LOC126892505 [Diabrotica virgifera virgifera]|uniref:Uncharacterized protein n=1 Tax=Diabrotica virgifera virgifera TaxID=50390 RepID=A0ABM5L6F4_DIAVI|nr:uncharacterized protein LOC126892505 [Diabrotica virgifera virgifera]